MLSERAHEIFKKLSNDEIQTLQSYYTNKYKKNNRSSFSKNEDEKLCELVKRYGDDNWTKIADNMPSRSVRQCRERWRYYLSPEINKKPWTDKEDASLIKLVELYGPHWVVLKNYFPDRTDVNLKNRWIVLLRRGASQTKNHQSIIPHKIQQEKNEFFKDFIEDDFSFKELFDE